MTASTPLITSDTPLEPTLSTLFNRDVSWLEFNHRVLHEARDSRTPLLDRLKFLAIYSNNSDEFFMKRIGMLRRKMASNPKERSSDGSNVEQHLAMVQKRVNELTSEVISLWNEDLRPALEREGIHIRDYADLSPEQKAKAGEYFRSMVFPVLTPLAVDPGHPFPFISNLSLNIGVLLRQPGKTETLFARIKVPELLSRWLTFHAGGEYVFCPIESLIEARLDSLFTGMEILEYQHFRVTRNAEVEAEMEDPEDLLEMVQEELRARRFADLVRVQITQGMSQTMRHALIEGLETTDNAIYELPEPLGKADLLSIAMQVDRPDLKVAPWKPETAPALADPEADMFALLRQGDILVHHPYESFNTSVERFILQAVNDPKVLAIKMTLYRTTGDSPFVSALARAAEAGKQVAVMVELKARFDEERNIQWARTLEEAGAHVVYGILGLKTHTKTALVVRREDDRLRCYAHIATGNYNSKTALVYTDIGLFTTREDLCEDVVDLFAFLTGRSLKRDYRKLLVAPLAMRKGFMALIEQEARNAQAGRPARIIAKMNQLEDPEVINALYKASQAGVPVDLIVRGFCCLRPGVKGLSENVRVISVIGRFLEHSRIFYFLNDGGAEQFYLSSADWMTRNLSHRVEAAVPVEDPSLQARLREILEVSLADNRQAWELCPDGLWCQRSPAPGEPERGTHLTLMHLTRQRVATANVARLAHSDPDELQ